MMDKMKMQHSVSKTKEAMKKKVKEKIVQKMKAKSSSGGKKC